MEFISRIGDEFLRIIFSGNKTLGIKAVLKSFQNDRMSHKDNKILYKGQNVHEV
jgi:hypothetical protein